MLFTSFPLFYIHILSPVFRHAHSCLDNFVFIFAFEFTFCIYYFIHNTHVTHILSLKKNGLPIQNIGITKYFLSSICCVVILICSFLNSQLTKINRTLPLIVDFIQMERTERTGVEALLKSEITSFTFQSRF